MVKIIVDEDCGNAPLKQLLKEFYIAFAKKDLPFISQNLSEDVTWNKLVDKCISGREKVLVEIEQMVSADTTELTISNIITRGKTAAANGLLKYRDKKSYAFCDVYKFGSVDKKVIIKQITSYGSEVIN